MRNRELIIAVKKLVEQFSRDILHHYPIMRDWPLYDLTYAIEPMTNMFNESFDIPEWDLEKDRLTVTPNFAEDSKFYLEVTRSRDGFFVLGCRVFLTEDVCSSTIRPTISYVYER